MTPRFLLAALLLALAPAAASAQAAAGVLAQSYRFDDPQAAGLTDFRLFTLPFVASLSAGRFGLEVGAAYARGEATGPDGSAAELSGPTDTHAALVLEVIPDRVVLRTLAVLPTGRSSQSLTESAVAGVVAAELLPFAIATWGNGGSVGADLALAHQAGGVGMGLSVGFEAAQEFEPLVDQAFAYRPGDQVRVRFALDADVGDSGTFSLLLGGQRFSEDQVGGANLFQSGNRLEAVASYAFAVGLRGSAMLYGGAFHRARGSLLTEAPSLDGATASPSQQLFTGGANVALPLGARATLLPDVEARVFRAADGVGQGWLSTVGGTLDLRLGGPRFGRRVILSPTGRYRFGHVVAREGVEYGLSGWEAGLTLRVEGGR